MSADAPPAFHAEAESPSLGAQAVWLLAAKTISFGLAIALPLVLVRRLSQVDFGLYKLIFLVVGTTVTVLPLGFGMSAFYFLPRERERQGTIVTNIIVFHVAVGAVVAAILAIYPGLLARLFNSPELTAHAWLIALMVLLWSTGTFLEIAPVAMQDVRASTAIIIANQCGKTFLFLGAAIVWGTVQALIVAGVVYGVLQVALMLAYLHRRFPGFWRSFDAPLLWQQAGYALPVGAGGLLWRLQEDVHQAFVSNAFGPAAYAIYAVGMFRMPLVGMLRESVGSVVLPRINVLETRNAPRAILELVAAAARKLAMVYIPTYALMMVTGRELITFLFTAQYAASWPIFAIALTFEPFAIIVLDPVTRARSERYFFLWLRVVIFSTLVLVLWKYSAALGMVGVITVVMIANFTGWLVAVFRMARFLDARPRDFALFADVGRVMVAAGLAAAVTAMVRLALLPGPPWRVLVVCAPVFSGIYLAGVIQARVLRRDEVVRLAREVMRSITHRDGSADDRAIAAATSPPAPGVARSRP